MSDNKDFMKECQNNEFEAIAAIFPDEVRDLRKCNEVKKWKPLEIEIKIFPEESMTVTKECKTQVGLYVKCSANYPKTSPFVDIRNAIGLLSDDVVELKSELFRICKANVGKEVILELVFFTRSFLYNHKRPHFESFYDEMVCNQQRREVEKAAKLKKEMQEEETLARQKLESIKHEERRKLEALKEVKRRLKANEDGSTSILSSSPPELIVRKSSISRHRSRSTSLGKETCTEQSTQAECKEILNTKLKFTGKKDFTINCGRCLKHNERGCIIYHGMDVSNGNPVIVIKWTLQFSVSHKLKGEEWEALQSQKATYLKQITSIEQEFKTLRHLNSPNLVHYLGMNCVQKKDKIIIYVLQEYISGCTIPNMYGSVRLTIQQLQHYTPEILKALNHLHISSIVHRNLRSSSLFIDSNGLIRVSDFSLDKRLYDLHRTLTNEAENDPYPPSIGKGGKKGDIYRLGVLLLSLSVEILPKDVKLIKVPDFLNPTFKDFLNKCFLHDEQERWSAEQLLSHPFLASPSIHAAVPKEIDVSLNDREDSVDFPILNNEIAHGSRLKTEFDILKSLGKGGFGCVWKVKNKLDARIYALKQIALNPSNKQLNRKIKREVKLLSRLNHENIVRYYNSWIEATPETDQSITCSSDTSTSEIEVKTGRRVNVTTNSLVQWEIINKNSFSSDDEDECYDNDLSIIFMDNDDPANQDNEKNKKASLIDSPVIEESTCSTDLKLNSTVNRVRQYMYIQMEFCEKSTLRTAIDNGLHKDVSLVWRLFREIVEGLHHIHQQGVIHRDLKPVNIFLDSKDHVKIGDFGLATDAISKPLTASEAPSCEVDHSRSDIGDGTQTGNVGTALYVAPELVSTIIKASYSQKVDIYSLGIIFFEMCYPPSETGMERSITISNLRQRDIILPTDASGKLTEEMIQIIMWLLQHDVCKRPSSNELITSKYIPPLLMEETELNSLLHTTVSNPQSRMYKHMINALFDQKVATEFDFTYDIDAFKSQRSKNKPNHIFTNVVDALNKIMRLHGAVYFSVPTLMPKSSVINAESSVHVMEHGGAIVTLPHNLRIPFARYVARREIEHLKRYALEKVFREQKVFGCHPREQHEFAFDIVTPTPDSFLPDAEILSAVSEIVTEFRSLDCRNYYIRLNHVSLLKAILLYAEIDELLEADIYEAANIQKSKTITKAILIDDHYNFQLSQRTVSRLSQFVEIEENIDKMFSVLHPVLQKKGVVCDSTKKCLKELKSIVTLAQALGVKLPILICPGLVHNITLFSGMLFQYVCKVKPSKRAGTLDILAAGGRYDKLISSFKFKLLNEGGKCANQSAVGVSVAIESIIAAEIEVMENQLFNVADFLIHSEDTGMSSEKANLVKELWDLGLNAMVLYDKTMNLEDAVEFCRNQGIPYVLALKKDDPGIIKVRSIEKDKVTEKKIIHPEIKDCLPKLCSRTLYDCVQYNKADYSRSASIQGSSSSGFSLNVRFLPQDKTHSNRKREQNILTHVITTLQTPASRVWELIPVDLKMVIVGAIVSNCDISASVDAVQRTFDSVIDEFAKYKKYLSQLCEEICDAKTKKPNSAIILYSLPENNFRILF